MAHELLNAIVSSRFLAAASDQVYQSQSIRMIGTRHAAAAASRFVEVLRPSGVIQSPLPTTVDVLINSMTCYFAHVCALPGLGRCQDLAKVSTLELCPAFPDLLTDIADLKF
jgi:hypothetical protein